MKVISQQAELSTTYTNHSIKATTITILNRSGFKARHIMSVSGHRNESRIKSYNKTDESTKTNMAGSLRVVIDNKKSEAEMKSLDYLQEEFILRDSVKRSNSQPLHPKHKAV